MIFVCIISFILILLDIISKLLIINNLQLYDTLSVLPNFFDITYIKNYGGAFNILSGGKYFFIILGIIAVILIVKFILLDNKLSNFDLVAYSLVLSGIIGNLIDRIIYGGVVDFLSFTIFGYSFPVFNFADTFIVIGTIMIIIILLIKGDSDENIRCR